jgi:DNA helicase II / ATP-dependent DNA helicase PcrA
VLSASIWQERNFASLQIISYQNYFCHASPVFPRFRVNGSHLFQLWANPNMEEHLRRLLIPYVVVGSKSFYERKGIKDTLAYLRLLYNPKDNQALLRVVNEPSRKIGNVTLTKLQLWGDDQHWSLFEAVQQIEGCPTLKAEARRALAAFGALIQELLADKTRLALPELFDAVLEKTGYLADLEARKKEEDIGRSANLAERRRVAEECAAEAEPAEALELFLEQAGLLGATENEQTGANGTRAEE